MAFAVSSSLPVETVGKDRDVTVAGEFIDADSHRHDHFDAGGHRADPNRDEVLARAFLCASRSRGEVVAVNERLLMATSVAASHIGAVDQSMLWGWARAHRDSDKAMLPSQASEAVRVSCRSIHDGRALAGVLIELQLVPLESPHTFHVAEEEFATVLPGSSGSTVGLRSQLAHASARGGHTLLTGEPGVGKTTIARRLLELHNSEAIHELDADATDAAWSVRLGAALQYPRVLLTHIDALAPADLATTLSAVASLETNQQVVATASNTGPVHPRMSPFPTWVNVPPLRQRLEDLPAIATEVMACLRHNGKVKRLAPGVRRQLWGHHWPGNITELTQVLHDAVLRAPTAVVDESCIRLPVGEAAGLGARRRSLVKAAELSSLLDALDRCGGNKVAAADMLGISRSTLYRKARALGI